jgi:hypothetical protein
MLGDTQIILCLFAGIENDTIHIQSGEVENDIRATKTDAEMAIFLDV